MTHHSLRVNHSAALMALSLASLGGCSMGSFNPEGWSCADVYCIADYECSPFDKVCVRALDWNCSADALYCPTRTVEGDTCPTEGAFIGCADSTVACESGCRVCRATFTWSECRDVPGSPVEGSDGVGGRHNGDSTGSAGQGDSSPGDIRPADADRGVLRLNPTSVGVRANHQWQFEATGGFPELTFSVNTGDGQVDSSGFYTAPMNVGASSEVRVTDARDVVATASVTTISGVEHRMCADRDANTRAPAGQIYDSGGSSADYRSDEDCTLLIEPAGGGTITLSVSLVDLNNFEVLKVYDGRDVSVPELVSISGTTVPSPVTAVSGSMFLSWHSSSSGTAPGWSASWATSGSLPLAMASSPVYVLPQQEVTLNVFGGVGPFLLSPSGAGGFLPAMSQDGYTLLATAPSTHTSRTVLVTDAAGLNAEASYFVGETTAMCQREWTRPWGRLVDSGGPMGSYSNNERCDYLLETGADITLAMEFIDTEASDDTLTVYDGRSAEGILLDTFSGTNRKAPVTAQSGAMFLRWRSDTAIADRGFSAWWYSHPQQLTLLPRVAYIESGAFIDLNAVGGVAPYEFRIVSGPGALVAAASEGGTRLALGVASGESVVAVTDTLGAEQLTTVSIVETMNMCSSQSSSWDAAVLYDSGGPDSNYGSSENCSLLIQPTTPGTIRLQIFEFRTESYDRLTIYDGDSSASPVRATLDGSVGPVDIVLTSGSAYLNWDSDFSFTYAGFKIIWMVE